MYSLIRFSTECQLAAPARDLPSEIDAKRKKPRRLIGIAFLRSRRRALTTSKFNREDIAEPIAKLLFAPSVQIRRLLRIPMGGTFTEANITDGNKDNTSAAMDYLKSVANREHAPATILPLRQPKLSKSDIQI